MTGPATDPANTARLIDTWFPCPEVDVAVRTPAGSGRSEKALFTWFASRPIAQARAAVLTTLLPDNEKTRSDIRAYVLSGDRHAAVRLRDQVAVVYPDKPPVVLDLFSGRGIIPLEAARAGATAVGTDLSPVATLAGRLLADYPLRNWDAEPTLPFSGDLPTPDLADDEEAPGQLRFAVNDHSQEPRLVRDVRAVLAEVQRRVAAEVAPYYPGNPERAGAVPWAYLWAVTIPCDRCKRRFPLIGSLVLRHPYRRTQDQGEWLRIDPQGDELVISVVPGTPSIDPTFTSTGARGKAAKCPFPSCGNVHSLDVVKSKGLSGQYGDRLLAVAEILDTGSRKVFRTPRRDEIEAAQAAADVESLPSVDGLAAIPDEVIPEGNTNTLQASLYGYGTYGSLMNRRQARLVAVTAQQIRLLHTEMSRNVSSDYASALAGYAAANLTRQIRYTTRGAPLRSHGRADGSGQNRCQVGDIFASQSIIKHNFDYLETGPGTGPGTWASVSKSLLDALAKVAVSQTADGVSPARLRLASAVALPYRDGTADAVICDPPYYDMITYSDASDVFYVWLKRALGEAMPELFGGVASNSDGLQDKADEIIVKSKGRRVPGEHRTQDFYEAMMLRSFEEANRILKASGRLTVVFGHSDPQAWLRLLTALTDAGFVVTSSWPSRTETAVTGVATINVTVSIGCRVAPEGRPIGLAAQVDSVVMNEVKARCKQWDEDGLAMEDQQMASYGAALAVVGRYSKVITPGGDQVPLMHYMTLGLKAVTSAIALRLDSLPLETFDPLTRFAVLWHEMHGRSDVPKGAALFVAQSDGLGLDIVRGPILNESAKGFSLRYDAPAKVTPASSRFEVVRGMAAAWQEGSDAVAQVIDAADISATDQHLWAVADWLGSKLPTSDPVCVALTAIKRNKPAIQAAVNPNLLLRSE